MPDKIMSTEDKQQASLSALLYLDRFCRENNLRYYLAYGTLIGAVRHKGFIPWDDDVDIHIPRPDYEKLLTRFEDPTGNFKLISCFNDKEYNIPYAKIQNMNTARVLNKGKLDHQGIGIDLFPLDGLPEDLQYAEKAFSRANEKWLKVANRLERFRVIWPHSVLDYCKMLTGKTAFAVGYISKAVQKFSKGMFDCEYEDSDKVATVVGIYSNRLTVFDRDWFEPCELEFEGYKLVCPKNYHEILTASYGDYMKLPPEGERISTHTDRFAWKY